MQRARRFLVDVAEAQVCPRHRAPTRSRRLVPGRFDLTWTEIGALAHPESQTSHPRNGEAMSTPVRDSRNGHDGDGAEPSTRSFASEAATASRHHAEGVEHRSSALRRPPLKANWCCAGAAADATQLRDGQRRAGRSRPAAGRAGGQSALLDCSAHSNHTRSRNCSVV